MSAVSRLLRVRLTDGSPDAWLSFWGCSIGAAAIACFSVSALWQYATTRAEFVIGTLAAGVASLHLVLLGVLARRVHVTVEQGRVSWRERRRELLSHGIGTAAVGFGGWALVDASPGVAGWVTGSLLLLAAYTAALCLGCWTAVAPSGQGPGVK